MTTITSFQEGEQEKFKNSPVMERVNAVESFYHVHGLPEYEGRNLLEEFSTSRLTAMRFILERALERTIGYSNGVDEFSDGVNTERARIRAVLEGLLDEIK